MCLIGKSSIIGADVIHKYAYDQFNFVKIDHFYQNTIALYVYGSVYSVWQSVAWNIHRTYRSSYSYTWRSTSYRHITKLTNPCGPISWRRFIDREGTVLHDCLPSIRCGSRIFVKARSHQMEIATNWIRTGFQLVSDWQKCSWVRLVLHGPIHTNYLITSQSEASQ